MARDKKQQKQQQQQQQQQQQRTCSCRYQNNKICNICSSEIPKKFMSLSSKDKLKYLKKLKKDNIKKICEKSSNSTLGNLAKQLGLNEDMLLLLIIILIIGGMYYYFTSQTQNNFNTNYRNY